MNIKLNNISDTSKQKDIISFSNSPTVITVEPTGLVFGKYAYRKFNCENLKLSDTSKEGKIYVNGNAIIATNDIKKVKGNRFYLNGTATEYTTFTIVQALKNISDISLNYYIEKVGKFDFLVTAKEYGAKYNIDVEISNLSNFFTTESQNGSINNELIGDNTSKVYVDLYYNNSEGHRKLKSSSDETNWTYLTTLNKEFYKDSVKFDISTSLNSVLKDDTMTLWKADIYAQVDDALIPTQTINNNYIKEGYSMNNISYINAETDKIRLTYPLINLGKDDNGNLIKNNIDGDKLYVYDSTIPISFLMSNSTIDVKPYIDYLGLADGDKTTTFTIPTSSNKDIAHLTISLNEDFLRKATKVRLRDYEGVWMINFDVIQPSNANAECHRIYWKNSFGGVSFFDFVGDKDEERKITSVTYKIPTLDYFDLDGVETEVVYDKSNEITTTLTSHLIEKEGLNQLYDLEMSRVAWIIEKGVKHYVIVQALEIEEMNEQTYRAKIKYKLN